ncbi:hypothetical protein HPB47_005861 [Ixodes persulcatus]|uniref:Uncharacterized protein n=1 Tax=Ixodes persulcatus TaxID=34615 RepID=A0AC60PBU9_IXOPE|nr:hypothetical protein HPB47_005861 [Ixodes persulcatus]
MPGSRQAYACEKASRKTRTLALLEHASKDIQEAECNPSERRREQRSTPAAAEHARGSPIGRSVPVDCALSADSPAYHLYRQDSRCEGAGYDQGRSFAELAEGGPPGLDDSEGNGDSAGEGTNALCEFQDFLRDRAVESGIKRRPLTALLKILRRWDGMSDLPKDGRTLLQTPCKPHEQFPFTPMAPGNYCHFGLAAGLQHSLRNVEWLPARAQSGSLVELSRTGHGPNVNPEVANTGRHITHYPLSSMKAQFPKIQQLFLKQTIAVPSSASVERRFSGREENPFLVDFGATGCSFGAIAATHFQREQSRGLDEIDRLEAVGFRLLLFYTGPLLLKSCLPEDLYTAPFESSRLGIFIVARLSTPKPWPLRNVRKMVKLPWDSKFVALPELHKV